MSQPEIYDQLADHLNSMPIGAPKAPELLEILKVLFSEEEASLAVTLPFFPMTLKDLSERTGWDEEKLKPLLDKMIGNGTVFVEMETPEPMYRLLPTVVGFSETPFWAGKRTPTTEKLAKLWTQYKNKGFYREIGGLSDTPLVRVIPLEETMDDPRTISNFDKVAELVKETSYQAVAHCPCRLMKEYSGNGRSKYSTENCLHFGSLGRYIVAQGMAREITVDETIAILKKSQEEGLVHITGNFQGTIETICNCCADACIFLTGLMAMGEKNMFSRSNYVSQIDQETCAECGTCAERCPVDAISLDEGPAQVAQAKCIGCGVCHPTCPSEAISLTPRADEEQKPLLPIDQVVTNVMQDKQRQMKF